MRAGIAELHARMDQFQTEYGKNTESDRQVTDLSDLRKLLYKHMSEVKDRFSTIKNNFETVDSEISNLQISNRQAFKLLEVLDDLKAAK